MTGHTTVLRNNRESEKACEHCGSPFRKKPEYTWAYFRKQKYCSQNCAGAAWSIERVERRKPMLDAFNDWFHQGEGCWEWVGATDRDGYGIFSYAGVSSRAARVALFFDGRAPGKKFACHHCDNPKCVRPDHLFVGTHEENMADMVAKDRQKKGVH